MYQMLDEKDDEILEQSRLVEMLEKEVVSAGWSLCNTRQR